LQTGQNGSEKMKDIENYVKKAKNGDTDSFGMAYEMIEKDLYKFAYYMVKNENDACDAVQNACLFAFQNLKKLNKNSSFKPWMMKILANECKKILMSKQKFSGNDIADFEDNTGYDDVNFSDTEYLLSGLSYEEKNIIVLSVLYGYKSSEISDIIGINANTVRTKRKRALEKMKDKLKGE